MCILECQGQGDMWRNSRLRFVFQFPCPPVYLQSEGRGCPRPVVLFPAPVLLESGRLIRHFRMRDNAGVLSAFRRALSLGHKALHQTHPTPVSYTHLTLPTICSV